jgi:hypothetical protein
MYNNPLSRATYLETKRLKDVNDIGKEIIK